MSLLESVYNVAVNVLRPLLPAFGAASPKVSAAVEGRRAAAAAIARWAERERDPFRPLLWLHGASAGELAGAIPVVDRLRETSPGLQLLVTYSSPSAEGVLDELVADYAGYPPLETMASCREAVESSRPDAMVFAKLDAWPALTRVASDAGVRLGMINATVRPSSSRLRGPGRQLLTPSYRRLDSVGAVSEDEIARLELLGTRPEAIQVTGDASFERALDRIERARDRGPSDGPRLPARGPRTVRLCAGSTWPEDERVLIEAVARLQGSRVDAAPTAELELILVPHEPDAAAVRRIRALCLEHLGVEPRLWSTREGVTETGEIRRPLIVDAVGFLVELYLECDIAWVGGGIGGEGLHSVVEPAAASLPVLFGPVHDRWEARELMRRDAAAEAPPEGVPALLESLLADPRRRREMGAAGRDYVESGRGAGDASARLVMELLDPGSLP
ncbi:MAG: glycosyltransferase N-terminal domain-containing protein [Candidatus Palauibacterales bacterium]|nr:glycosyltransferase N-terminal domain-containing protein [Candidatus Palauibacterales bacterium]